MAASPLVDAASFRSGIINEVMLRVSESTAQAIRDGLRGVQVSVAPPVVHVAPPNVVVEGAFVSMDDLATEIGEMRKLLQTLIDVLRAPSVRTLTYSDGTTATLKDSR